MRNTTRLTIIFALTALVVSHVDNAAAQGAGVGTGRIGNAFEIRGTVESNVQGRTYPLNRGGSVYFNQWVNTRAKSVAGLQLLDQSTIHVGPNTSIHLDKSRYDPTKRSGVVSMHVKAPTRGTESYRIKAVSSDTATYHVSDPNGTLMITPPH